MLKESHGVTTFVGTDGDVGKEVVIKTTAVDTLSPATKMRLEHAASLLAPTHTTNLAAPLYGQHEGVFYMVSSFVGGETLRERLGAGPLGVLDTMALADAVLGSLEATHERGVLHLDVKPSNIVLTPASGAVLLDSGLTRSGLLDSRIEPIPMANATYVSPEYAGLLERGVDERSDFYALGIVLFECLAGRPPFDGEDVGELLRQHLSAEPPDLKSSRSDVPRSLERVIRHLLAKDPRDRYQSASSVRHDLKLVQQLLDRRDSESAFVAGLRDRRRTVIEPAFVGREKEVGELEAAVDRAREGNGGLVFVDAQSGGGKTWLLDELARRSAQTAWVLRGRGSHDSAQRPLQILQGVIHELIAASKSQPELVARAQRRLGDQGTALTRILPGLSQVLGPGSAVALGSEAHAEARSLPALVRLFDTLGTPERPAIVVIDDCQWADELTLKLLGIWLKRREGARHVAFVVAFRTDEVTRGHLLCDILPTQRIALAPLGSESIRAVLETMAGAVPEALVALVAQLSEGNPFMVAAVLQGLFETGALVASPAGWVLETRSPAGVTEAQSSRRAASLLVRRLDLLSPTTLELLSVGAVLGKSFDPDWATEIAGNTPREAMNAFAEAKRRQIVWSDARGSRTAFVHDKLREAMLARLTKAERRALHERAATWIEARHPSRAFELAHHYDAAGLADRALAHALETAEQARAEQALDLSMTQYRIAERAAEGADRPTRRRLMEGLGDVLMLRGEYDEARDKLELAAEVADDEVARAEIIGKLGELAFKRGDMRKASAAIEQALELLGRRIPQRAVVVFFLLVFELVVQALHCVFPALVARRTHDPSANELLAMRLYSRLAYAYWFGRGKIHCGWAHLRGMNLAERYLPTAELAQAYSEHAPVATMIPWFARGIDYAARSLAIRERRGDVWGQGQSLNFFGVVLYGASRFAECIAKCTEAARLLERAGDRWEENTARWHIAFSHYRVGNLALSVEGCKEVHRIGLEIGDHQAAGIAIGGWAKASLGHVPEALIHAELERTTGDIHARTEVLLAQALYSLRQQRPDDAVETLEQADTLVRKASLRQEYVAPVLPWLATALRIRLEMLPAFAYEERRSTLRRARTVVRRAVRLARSYQNNLPHALREAALLAATGGARMRARRLFDESIEVSTAQGASYEQAQSIVARARVGQAFGWAQVDDDVQSAERLIERLEEAAGAEPVAPSPVEARPLTLSLADRFATVLESGRGLVSALSEEAIYAQLEKFVLLLLRGERCIVFRIAEDCSVEPIAGTAASEDLDAHAALVRRAIAFGSPVVLEAEDRSADERLDTSGTGSALCALVRVRSRVVACFCVSHRGIPDLFGEEEKHLADFVATLAGAALENSEGFAQLTVANRALEAGLVKLTETRSQLALAQRMASVGTLAAGVAHEINNPLAYVTSNLEFCLEEIAGLCARRDVAASAAGSIRDALTDAKDGAERIRRIVRDIKTFSRVEEDSRERVDVRQILDSAVAMAGNEIRHRAQLSTRYDEVPHVLANAGRLGQVFVNLLVNAAQAIPEGRAEDHSIEVRARHAHGRVIVEVSDSGAGIQPEILDRIFDPFFTTKAPGLGTGLGLAICHGIVTKLGGAIRVESRPGGGTMASVELDALLETVATKHTSVVPSAARTGRRGRVLVIDDEVSVGRALSRALAREHDVIVANGGREALKALEGESEFDVVFCDLMMPDSSGSEIYERVLALGRGIEKRFIFMTGGAFTATSREFLARVPNQRLEKPFAMAALRSLVSSMVAARTCSTEGRGGAVTLGVS